jgi:hypothetical protein
VTATNFGGFKERLIKAYGGDESKVPWPQGVHTVEEGAKNVVRLATLGIDGETERVGNKNGMLPW